MTIADIDKAIAIIANSRQTHVDWKKWIEDYPEEACKPRPEVDVAGDAKFHQECIEGYDFVLHALGEVKSNMNGGS